MKAIKKIANWISNGNDCEYCPACWSERYHSECGTEYDGGCYIYGDEYPEPCRLFLPKFIRRFLARRPQYLKNHQYDDFGDWWEKSHRGTEKIREALEEAFHGRHICWKDDKGQYHETSKDNFVYTLAFTARSAYNDFLREPRKTIRQKWSELIRETISIPVDFIKSYVGK